MTDRELLQRLYTYLQQRSYVTLDDAALKDMVLRYQFPLLTAYSRVVMQMTAGEFNALNDLMKTIEAQLKAERVT